MSQIHWLNAVNGSFTNPSDWSGGVVPSASDDAILDAAGQAFTVTSSVNETVKGLQLTANATLSLTGGIFTADIKAGSVANAGIVLIGAGATMVAGGKVTNSGTMALYGSGGDAALLFEANTTLSGGGEILMDGQGEDVVAGDLLGYHHHFVTVYNIDNTITGSGTLGDYRMSMVNDKGGIVDANGSTPLVVDGFFYNSGLVEATNGGTLVVGGRGFGGSPHGVVLAGDGSKVVLKSGGDQQGTIKSVGSGVIIAQNSRLGVGPGYLLTIDAQLVVKKQCSFLGSIENNGDISVKNAYMEILQSVTLQGSGEVNLSEGVIEAPGSEGSQTLTLESGTILGSGDIGASGNKGLALAVGAAGVIDNNTGKGLMIGANASAIINAGTIESTGAGGVAVEYAIINSGVLTATDGVFSIGTSSMPSETISNTGTLSVSGAGTLIAKVAVSGDGVASINGGTLDFASTFNEAVTFTGTPGVLELADSRQFTNTISGFSTNGTTSLDLDDIKFVGAGEATFSGTASGGVLTVTDGKHTAQINLMGDYLSTPFTASSDGHGGTVVVAGPANGAKPLHAFVSAMAGFGTSRGGDVHLGEASFAGQPVLFCPRAAIA